MTLATKHTTTRESEAYRLGRRPSLDGIRAVSILTVVVGHCDPALAGNAGTAGVTVFFVLSGFLITRLLVEEHAEQGAVSLRAFYCRRVRRLLPAATFFLVAASAAHQMADYSWWPVLASAANIANIAILAGVPMHLLQHMWSLSMEEQFYLVWPAPLVFLLSRRPRLLVPLLACAALACNILRIWFAVRGYHPSRTMFGPDTRSDALVFGALLALILPRTAHWPWGRLALTGATVFLLSLPLGAQGVWTLLPVALAAAAMVGWAATRGCGRETSNAESLVGRLMGRGLLAALGRISYGVYLWHFPIAIILTVHMPPGLAILAALTLSVGFAAVSWRYVEEPFMRRRQLGPARHA